MRILLLGLNEPDLINQLTWENHLVISSDERNENFYKILKIVDGIVLRSPHCITDDMVEQASSLKFVIRAGSGTDNISSKIFDNNIAFLKIPINASAVAEHVFAMIFSIYRKIPAAHQSLAEGLWKKHHLMGREVNHKKLGIVGFGNIGRKVAQIGYALDMKILTSDHSIEKKEKQKVLHQTHAEFVPLDNLLSNSDIVVLCLPLNDSSKHIINSNSLALLQEDAVLINVGRGGLICTEDLLNHLSCHPNVHAALDVFEKEPPDINIPLYPNLLVTPHIGAQTYECRQKIRDVILSKIQMFVDKEHF